MPEPLKAFYINLDSRPDRRAEFEAECSRMGIEAERIPGLRAASPGLGCSLAHRNALQLAKDRGYPSVCIFEDDFQFLVSKDEYDSILSALPEDYDVVMLSYAVFRSEPYTDRFGRVLDAQTGSGYIVSSRFYTTLLATWTTALEAFTKEPHVHWLYMNDQSWKVLQPMSRWYYSLVRVGHQRPSWSDLAGSFVSYGV